MQNFEDASETCKQSFVSAFSIYMTVPLNKPETFSYRFLVEVLMIFIEHQVLKG